MFNAFLVEVCCFLSFNHEIPYMLTWIFWKIPSPYFPFSLPRPALCCMSACNRFSWGEGNYIHSHHIFTTITTFFHYHHSIFIPFTIPKNFFPNDPLMHFTSCIDIHWHDSSRLRKGFLILSDALLCTLIAYDFQWSVWLQLLS